MVKILLFSNRVVVFQQRELFAQTLCLILYLVHHLTTLRNYLVHFCYPNNYKLPIMKKKEFFFSFHFNSNPIKSRLHVKYIGEGLLLFNSSFLESSLSLLIYIFLLSVLVRVLQQSISFDTDVEAMPVMWALGRLRLEDPKFEPSLSYIEQVCFSFK